MSNGAVAQKTAPVQGEAASPASSMGNRIRLLRRTLKRTLRRTLKRTSPITADASHYSRSDARATSGSRCAAAPRTIRKASPAGGA